MFRKRHNCMTHEACIARCLRTGSMTQVSSLLGGAGLAYGYLSLEVVPPMDLARHNAVGDCHAVPAAVGHLRNLFRTHRYVEDSECGNFTHVVKRINTYYLLIAQPHRTSVGGYLWVSPRGLLPICCRKRLCRGFCLSATRSSTLARPAVALPCRF